MRLNCHLVVASICIPNAPCGPWPESATKTRDGWNPTAWSLVTPVISWKSPAPRKRTRTNSESKLGLEMEAFHQKLRWRLVARVILVCASLASRESWAGLIATSRGWTSHLLSSFLIYSLNVLKRCLWKVVWIWQFPLVPILKQKIKLFLEQFFLVHIGS